MYFSTQKYSIMNFNKFTIKAQDVVQKASTIATSSQQQIIQTGHILKSALDADENMTKFLVNKLEINLNLLTQVLDEYMVSYPKSSGTEAYLSNDSHAAIREAETYLKIFKDEFVAIEHIFLDGLRTDRRSVLASGLCILIELK